MDAMRDKIKAELISGYLSSNPNSRDIVADKIIAIFDTHDEEQAVRFAEWCKDGWLINNDGSYFHETSKRKVANTHALYQLFIEETKTK